ncbi:MAG: hypothetical protein M1814_004030 [Vezdaea aestivalis]|nr:MAG: hypothetical protein M1814_004030 [Vezdaea aestivalis]
MAEIGDFEEVFSFNPNYTYDQSAVRQIVTHRKELGNKLFLDRLFEAVGIEQGPRLYPPKTNNDLRTLFQKISASPAPLHYRQSILYYLLQDSDEAASEAYATTTFLPEQFRLYTAGLWLLDQLDFDQALLYLTKPHLTPTFQEEILSTLLTHCSSSNPHLPLAYMHAVLPSLTTPSALDLVFRTHLLTSLPTAYGFTRTQNAALHRSFFEQLVTRTLEQPRGEARASACAMLVNLPFDEEEEWWFEEFLTEGSGRGLVGARDAVAMRRLGMGKYREAVGTRGLSGVSVDGVGWDVIKEGVERGLGSR